MINLISHRQGGTLRLAGMQKGQEISQLLFLEHRDQIKFNMVSRHWRPFMFEFYFHCLVAP